jgi:hypothetical protein
MTASNRFLALTFKGFTHKISLNAIRAVSKVSRNGQGMPKMLGDY